MRRRRLTAARILGGLLLVPLIAVAVGFWWLSWALSPPERRATPAHVDLRPGLRLSELARKLEEAGAIRSAPAFELLVRWRGMDRRLRAGDYEFPPGSSARDVMRRLISGESVTRWVVIPEGKTTREIAQIVADRGVCDAGEFLAMAARTPRGLGVDLPASIPSCDGLLMPDSYRLPRRLPAKTLVTRLVRNWARRVWAPRRAAMVAGPFTPRKLIVIASLIEREARVDGDRPLISSVIRNRLRLGMRLQIDATVLYALGRHKEIVTFEDLKVESPYNTYRQTGLPPGPICNPGEACMDAALRPAKTDYLYYVANPDGSHTFTRTAEQHARAVAFIRAQRRAGDGT